MESLLSKGHHVYALTRKPRKLDVFNSRLEISDNYKDPVFSNYNFDVIFLLAANTSAYLHRTKPIEKLIEDVDISLGVISWVLKNSSVKPRIIHLGSMTQYGYETLGAISSKVATSATTFYDLAKQTIENYLRMLSVDGYIKFWD